MEEGIKTTLDSLLPPNAKLGVVIVDMQDSFLASLTEERRSRLLENHRALLQACRALRAPVASVTWKGDGPEHEYLRGFRCRRFQKKDENAFTVPGLAPYLQSRGVEALLVGGVYTSACVRKTVIGARGQFQVATADDIISQDCGPNEWNPRDGLYLQSFTQILPVSRQK